MKKSFEEYDKDNPKIWDKFESMALDLISRGKRHYGAKAICEVIRYNTIVRGTGEYKINNNYTAGYARKFAAKYKNHASFFEFRQKSG